MHRVHSNLQSLISKPIPGVIEQIPNQITNGKISNNINNNYNTFNINNIFKNVLPKHRRKFQDAKENRKDSQKSNHLKPRRKRATPGKPDPREEAPPHPGKNYFLRDQVGQSKPPLERPAKARPKGQSQSGLRRRSRSKRKLNCGKKPSHVRKTDAPRDKARGGAQDAPKRAAKGRRDRDEGGRRTNRDKTRGLKRAKSIEKIYAKLEAKRAIEESGKYASVKGLLKGHKSIPHLKHFTDRKRSGSRRRLVPCRSKKGLRVKLDTKMKIKPRAGAGKGRPAEAGDKGTKRTQSRKRRAENKGQHEPVHLRKQVQRKKKGAVEGSLKKGRRVNRETKFYETVDDIGGERESLMDKVKNLKFSELPKKSIKQKEKGRFGMRAGASKVKFAVKYELNVPGGMFPARAKARKAPKQSSIGKNEKKPRSKSGQKVMYHSRRKNKNRNKAQQTQRPKLGQKWARRAKRSQRQSGQGSQSKSVKKKLPRKLEPGKVSGRKHKIRQKRAKAGKRPTGAEPTAQSRRIRTIEEFFEKLENKDSKLRWKNMSKEQMGGLLMKARDMFREYYGANGRSKSKRGLTRRTRAEDRARVDHGRKGECGVSVRDGCDGQPRARREVPDESQIRERGQAKAPETKRREGHRTVEEGREGAEPGPEAEVQNDSKSRPAGEGVPE